MEEKLIEFQTAQLAKEKGFDNILTSHVFDLQQECHYLDGCSDYIHKKALNWTFRPTQGLLQKWLREVHKLHIEVEFTDSTTQYYYEYSIVNSNERDYCDASFTDSAKRIHDGRFTFKSYEEALEEGLIKSLKLIK
jgi:hypothetical protein